MFKLAKKRKINSSNRRYLKNTNPRQEIIDFFRVFHAPYQKIMFDFFP